MASAFLPGWDASVTIDAKDLTLKGQTLGFTKNTTLLPKPTFGTKWRSTIEGQSFVGLSLGGHVDPDVVQDLEDIDAQQVAVTFIVQIGTPASATDGGSYTGAGAVGTLEFTSDADGQWSWSLELESDGTVSYAPGTGGT